MSAAFATVPARLLGRLLRLSAQPAAAGQPFFPPRRGLSCSCAARSGVAPLGTGADVDSALPPPPPPALPPHGLEPPASVEQADDFESLLDDDLESAAELGQLPRKIGAQAAEASRTGAFQRLPMVAPSKELLDSAVRRASRTPYNKKMKNEAQRAKNRAARALDALMKELCVPLGAYIKGFPAPARLHPFERALLELTVGPGTYERVLARVEALRRSTVEVGKAYATRASRAANKKEAVALQEEGFERLQAVFSRGSYAVDELKEVAKSLRRLPVVEPELPTVALVGAPNVGKSSLVQLLSSGLPEVQNYPFTTRSIKMGHFYVSGRRHQVTDTPGLLDRAQEERNAMERLTLACLQHLPTAVLFVADLTGECGTSVASQWHIRQELRGRFPGKPWLDVLSKADLLEEEFDEADSFGAAGAAGDGTARAGELAAPQEHAAAEPAAAGGGAVAQAAQQVQQQAEQQGEQQQAEQQGEQQQVSTAVQFAAALPGALRVSSTSGDGVDRLKVAMLRMLEQHNLQQQQQELQEQEQQGQQQVEE